MADSEDKSLNNIFMSTKMRSSSGKTKIIPNTAQNMYINQEDITTKTSKGKKTGTLSGGAKPSNKTSSSATTLNSILSSVNKKSSTNETGKSKVAFEKETFGETEDDENLSGSESGSEDDSDEEDASSIPEEVDPNDEPVDSDQSDAESEANSAIGSDEESEESEEDDEDEKEAETEYNDDDEKDERNNDEPDDDCLYQYDDLVDERDTERQPVQIPNDQRTTDPQMTHYERIRLLGIRTKQISMGAKVMVKYDGQLGATELAKYELNNKTTPLIIKRPLPDNTYELWKVSELNIGDDDNEQLFEELNQSFEQNQNLYQLV